MAAVDIRSCRESDLLHLGFPAKTANQSDDVLRGFGNNGGEEFLSFMMTSESLVVAGGEDWEAWYAKMYNLLSSIQNNDGSWSGHHCITSPVFCTAAVVMAMLADRDRAMLMDESSAQSSNG